MSCLAELYDPFEAKADALDEAVHDLKAAVCEVDSAVRNLIDAKSHIEAIHDACGRAYRQNGADVFDAISIGTLWLNRHIAAVEAEYKSWKETVGDLP